MFTSPRFSQSLDKTGLSLILPCFNEAGYLWDSYKKIVAEFQKYKIDYEIIFIDDQSQDNTVEIIKKIQAGDNRVKYKMHHKNQGRGQTVMDGIRIAKNDTIGFLDADLEISEKYIKIFVKKLEEGYDLAIAKRSYTISVLALHRLILSKGYHCLEKILLGLPFNDTQSGYKFFIRSKINPILTKIVDKNWFWDTEIVARSYYNDLKIVQIPVIFKRRLDKKSTVKIFSDSWTSFKSLWQFGKEYKFPGFVTTKLVLSVKNDIKALIMTVLKIILFPFAQMEKLTPKKGKILDLGCGEGTFTKYLAETSQNRQVIGIDYSIGRISKAKIGVMNKQNIKFILGDILKISYPKCDAVVLSDTLHHFNHKNQKFILTKCYKALRTDGMILIRDVNPDGSLKHRLSKFWDDILYPDAEPVSYLPPKIWVNILTKIGFNTCSTINARSWPIISTVLITAKKSI
ncbi:glycosyltransferase [Candidatus Daviesbacteria bacterium]|nr:glycosyltransferase [Candidatus Daviesbacteria bacterium]